MADSIRPAARPVSPLKPLAPTAARPGAAAADGGAAADRYQAAGGARQEPQPPNLPPAEAEAFDAAFAEEQARPLTPARDAAEARERAEAFWFNPEGYDTPFSRIDRDGPDANGFGDPDMPIAEQHLEANRALEEAALEKLGPEDRARYERVAGQMREDPVARLALQVLAVEGKLPGEATASDGSNVLAGLDRLATQPLAEGLDRAGLVSDLAQEIALPSSINQLNRSTCTVTSLQILIAEENPAEYARLVAGLAGPEGLVKLNGGQEIRREAGTERAETLKWKGKEGEWQDAEDLRTQSSRLWQPAMMEFANGDEHYDNVRDLTTRPDGSQYDGLFPFQTARALGGLLGSESKYAFAEPDGSAMRRIQESLDRGVSVPVELNWGEADADGKLHGGHAVLVTRADDGRVHFKNPWGREESMARAEFEKRLRVGHVRTDR